MRTQHFVGPAFPCTVRSSKKLVDTRTDQLRQAINQLNDCLNHNVKHASSPVLLYPGLWL